MSKLKYQAGSVVDFRHAGGITRGVVDFGLSGIDGLEDAVYDISCPDGMSYHVRESDITPQSTPTLTNQST